MSTAETAVRATVETYLEGLYEGDTKKLAKAFHPCAHLHSSKDGNVTAEPRDTWLEPVGGRPSPKAQGHARNDEVHDINVLDDAEASVWLEVAVGSRRFEDLLTLLPTAEGWRIVTKTYREL